MCEQKYHLYELEVLAIVEIPKRYRVYLLARSFKVSISAIKAFEKKQNLVQRIARWWWLHLQTFTFEIEHRRGTRMSQVDARSQNVTEIPPNELVLSLGVYP